MSFAAAADHRRTPTPRPRDFAVIDPTAVASTTPSLRRRRRATRNARARRGAHDAEPRFEPERVDVGDGKPLDDAAPARCRSACARRSCSPSSRSQPSPIGRSCATTRTIRPTTICASGCRRRSTTRCAASATRRPSSSRSWSRRCRGTVDDRLARAVDARRRRPASIRPRSRTWCARWSCRWCRCSCCSSSS